MVELYHCEFSNIDSCTVVIWENSILVFRKYTMWQRGNGVRSLQINLE